MALIEDLSPGLRVAVLNETATKEFMDAEKLLAILTRFPDMLVRPGEFKYLGEPKEIEQERLMEGQAHEPDPFYVAKNPISAKRSILVSCTDWAGKARIQSPYSWFQTRRLIHELEESGFLVRRGLTKTTEYKATESGLNWVEQHADT